MRDEVDDVDKMDNWSVHLCPHRLLRPLASRRTLLPPHSNRAQRLFLRRCLS